MFQSKFHRYHIISLGKTCRSYTLLAVLSWMRAPKKHDSATRTKEKHQGLFSSSLMLESIPSAFSPQTGVITYTHNSELKNLLTQSTELWAPVTPHQHRPDELHSNTLLDTTLNSVTEKNKTSKLHLILDGWSPVGYFFHFWKHRGVLLCWA